MQDADLLTLAEAAELTGLTPRALARRIERRSLPATKGEDGLRYVSRRDLAAAGLLDLATGEPPAWTRRDRPPADQLAQAVIDELTARGIRIADLERGHAEQAEQIEELRRQIRDARRERTELQRQLDQLRRRLDT
jgi:uncharacterized coiled-coil protein SlyX